jgi:hypothetical protein
VSYLRPSIISSHKEPARCSIIPNTKACVRLAELHGRKEVLRKCTNKDDDAQRDPACGTWVGVNINVDSQKLVTTRVIFLPKLVCESWHL